jgi:chemotaxis protein CheY-P-specific phosphatase CheC
MRIIAAYLSPLRASIFMHETRGQGEPEMSKLKLAIVSEASDRIASAACRTMDRRDREVA